jgi:hypothetical protein
MESLESLSQVKVALTFVRPRLLILNSSLHLGPSDAKLKISARNETDPSKILALPIPSWMKAEAESRLAEAFAASVSEQLLCHHPLLLSFLPALSQALLPLHSLDTINHIVRFRMSNYSLQVVLPLLQMKK